MPCHTTPHHTAPHRTVRHHTTPLHHLPALQLPTAAEVAKCLERVTEAQQRVQEALQGFKGEGGGDGHGIASWKAFLCELRALSVSDGVGPTVLGARQGCLATGDGGGGRGTRQQKRGFDDSAAAAAAAVRGDLSKGARFLLAELVPLEGVQVRIVWCTHRTDRRSPHVMICVFQGR